jgi:hypothetical protein
MHRQLKGTCRSFLQAALVNILQIMYVVISVIYINILSSNIKITTKFKNLKTISAHIESTDLIS